MTSVLDGTSWVPIENLTGTASLAFADGSVAGSGGINRFFGQVDVEDDRIRFGPLGSTRMAGSPEAMAAEHAFLSALDKARRWELAAGRLVLFDETDARVLELEPDGTSDATNA